MGRKKWLGLLTIGLFFCALTYGVKAYAGGTLDLHNPAKASFTSSVNSAWFDQSNPGDPYDMVVNIDNKLGGKLLDLPQYAGESLIYLHLPSGDLMATGYAGQVYTIVSLDKAPTVGTPVKVDIYVNWLGKSSHVTTTITDWQ